MPKRTFPIAAIAVAALALAACGGTVPNSEPAAEPPPEPPPASTEEPTGFLYPTDPGTVILDVTTGGGFVPVEVAVDTRPDFRLYGDGTVLVKPADESQPGFPVLETYQLSPDGIQAVLAEAESDGLLAPAPDYGQPPVSDMPSTTLTIALDDGSYSHSAYALGFDDASGLTPAQQEARERYQGFTSYLAALDTDHPELLEAEPAPYEPDAVRVYAWESQVTPEQAAPAWPLDGDIASWPEEPGFGARCETISEPDLDALTASIADQPWPYAWQSGGTTWSTGIALQLPGDPGCAA
jgi:hypothetical protein